jgi:hypothetical protein
MENYFYAAAPLKLQPETTRSFSTARFPGVAFNFLSNAVVRSLMIW